MRKLTAMSSISLAIAFCLAETPTVQADTQIAQFGGDSSSPKRHSRVRNPASLKPAEAQKIYLGLRNKMAGLYANSNHPIAKQYLDWKKYNTAPYISETHGKRYLNDYANKKAMAYEQFENAGTFPEGSIIAKDSFLVTEGEKLTTALFSSWRK